MRVRPGRVAWLLFGVTLSLPAAAQHDFDPSGRRHAPPGGGRHDGGEEFHHEKKKVSTDELIDRYTKALLSSPSSTFPLQKLGELYRGRDGNLDKLVGDFEQRAAA